MRLKIYSFIVFCVCFKNGLSQNAGDPCNQNGVPGKCLSLRDCPSVLADSSSRRNLKRCGFKGREPIICCLDKSVVNPVATPSPTQGSTTTEYVPPFNEYRDLSSNEGKCAPISKKLTAEKTGRKAWDKCLEYQEKLLYPCERGVDFLGKLSRGNNCNHKADELILGGTEAKRNEFPHMALLGFDQPEGSDPLNCGGAVISEKFILTAAHCTFAPRIGPVTTAKVGILRQSENIPASRIHRIKRIIKHPQYKAPAKYHDIALLETETTIKLDQNVIPACLDIGEPVDDSRASVTGWGGTENKTSSDILLKVTLMKYTPQECKQRYQPMRYLLQGYDEKTQVCYGDHTETRDTCRGDSGGPLQINNIRIHCMYTIIGVTSFGKICGHVGHPGIYTRLAAFTPWIESIVWA